MHLNFNHVVKNYIPIFGGEIGVDAIYKCHIFESITIVDPYGICCCHSWYSCEKCSYQCWKKMQSYHLYGEWNQN